jgi:AcrR family transcriptional regulator
MAVLERKKREKEARETLILDRAQAMLLKDGIQALNLDALAKEIEYAKGTIYQHFDSKEDLVLAVTARAMGHRADLFERAMKFQGSTREKIRAIGFATAHFINTYPDYYQLETTIRCVSFWERANKERQRLHTGNLGRCFMVVASTVRLAMEAGDLSADYGRPEKVAAALGAITIGTEIMGSLPEIAMFCGTVSPVALMRENQDIMLDGLGWRTLSKDLDKSAIDKRIRDEIFPEAAWFSHG